MKNLSVGSSNCLFISLFNLKKFFNFQVLIGWLIVIALPCVAAEQKPSGADLHQLWDRNCLTCHGHSADFSRTFLKIVDGKLQGPLHKDTFRLFLKNHYLAGKEVDGVYSMLMAETITPPRFKEECSACHSSAAILVRESITLRDGELYVAESDILISEYLQSHRRLTAEDIEFYMTLLTRVAHDIYRP